MHIRDDDDNAKFEKVVDKNENGTAIWKTCEAN